VYFVPDGQGDSKSVPTIQRPIVISDSADSIASSALSERMETFSDDEDFCIIDSPGLGITVSYVITKYRYSNVSIQAT